MVVDKDARGVISPPPAPDLAPLGDLVGAWEALTLRERAAVCRCVRRVQRGLQGVSDLHANLRAEGRL